MALAPGHIHKQPRIARPYSASIARGILVISRRPSPFSSPSVAERSERHIPFTKSLGLNSPCFHPLTVFLPRFGFASMLLLNQVRSCARRNLPNPDLLASKRCFSGGTDTSGGLETLRQLSGLLTDGGRRKKREIDFAIPKHIGIRARVEYGFQRINHRIGERGAIQRRQPRRCGSNHWRPPRNRVRENPETRPAKSPRAPAAATPSFHPDLTPQVSPHFSVGQAVPPAPPKNGETLVA